MTIASGQWMKTTKSLQVCSAPIIFHKLGTILASGIARLNKWGGGGHIHIFVFTDHKKQSISKEINCVKHEYIQCNTILFKHGKIFSTTKLLTNLKTDLQDYCVGVSNT